VYPPDAPVEKVKFNNESEGGRVVSCTAICNINEILLKHEMGNHYILSIVFHRRKDDSTPFCVINFNNMVEHTQLHLKDSH
jgi:hypothetical protein